MFPLLFAQVDPDLVRPLPQPNTVVQTKEQPRQSELGFLESFFPLSQQQEAPKCEPDQRGCTRREDELDRGSGR